MFIEVILNCILNLVVLFTLTLLVGVFWRAVKLYEINIRRKRNQKKHSRLQVIIKNEDNKRTPPPNKDVNIKDEERHTI
jgi:hypothetical protein